MVIAGTLSPTGQENSKALRLGMRFPGAKEPTYDGQRILSIIGCVGNVNLFVRDVTQAYIQSVFQEVFGRSFRWLVWRDDGTGHLDKVIQRMNYEVGQHAAYAGGTGIDRWGLSSATYGGLN